MGVNIFVNALLVLAVGIYFIPVENKKTKENIKDIPLVVFEKPKMFTLSQETLTRVVIANKAIKYKNRDEMFNANIVIKNEKPQRGFFVEKVKADLIISHGDILTFKDNVNYQKDSFINLNTSKLYYNTKEKIAYNDVLYDGNYYKNTVKGTDLYLNLMNNSLKSKNVHFEIDMKN
ncbi:hypothetical protein ACOJTA_03200 [Malaciobacter sp. WC5094]|uniref:hypothetical protein n=1 Tax=Arcobacter sp. YIC-80 TaxID=3376683 RepID=UPI00384CA807